MSAPRVFDLQHYEALNRARGDLVTRLLNELTAPLRLRTALDVGCGLGHFSGLLSSLGLVVTAVDGREDNGKEAARRFPSIPVHTFNAEDPAILSLGQFDLVFCFGLLYHLENPFLALRHLFALSRSLLLAEGLIYPGRDPVMGLVEEFPCDDQGLRNLAFYPTESCLAKMMYRVGYRYVYGFNTPPDHPEYSDAPGLPRNRTVLAASVLPLPSSLVSPLPEPGSALKPWIRSPATNPILKLIRSAKRRLF